MTQMTTTKERNMKELPIIFSPPMVKAILTGRKTVTRRLDGLTEINESPGDWTYGGVANFEGQRRHLFLSSKRERIVSVGVRCNQGDRLWVRETHWRFGKWVTNGVTKAGKQARTFEPVRAAGEFRFDPQESVPLHHLGYHKRPSIYMPREAARIILEVTAEERCERVQDISEADAEAEGVEFRGTLKCWPTAVMVFHVLWDSIHGEGAWDKNEWVRVIQISRIGP